MSTSLYQVQAFIYGYVFTNADTYEERDLLLEKLHILIPYLTRLDADTYVGEFYVPAEERSEEEAVQMMLSSAVHDYLLNGTLPPLPDGAEPTLIRQTAADTMPPEMEAYFQYAMCQEAMIEERRNHISHCDDIVDNVSEDNTNARTVGFRVSDI